VVTRARLLEPRSIFKAVAVNHISYRVADYARSRDFFVNLLGLAVESDDGHECVLTFGTPRRTIRIGKHRRPGSGPAVDQFAIAVRGFDLGGSADAMRTHGLQPEPSGDHGWTIRDPDGRQIQVCGASPSGSVDRPVGVFRAIAFNHLGYKVGDYATTRDFLVDLFGMRIAFEDGRTCSVAFGDPEDAIYIARNKDPGNGAIVDHVAFSVAGFDLADAERRLRDFGLAPEPDGAHAWTVVDPDGFRVQICDKTGVYPGAARDPYHDIG